MKKKIAVIFFALIIIIFAGTLYLNKVFLPTKIKSLIVSSIEQQLKKRAELRNLEFSIFKGLVLRDLVLYDDADMLLNIKEVSLRFFIPPILKKKLIIPSLNLKRAELFLERRSDNAFNVGDLFGVLQPKQTTSDFSVIISKIIVKDSRINFRDNTLSPGFTKSIDDLNLTASLSLPSSVKFNLKANIPAQPPLDIEASGDFVLPTQKLTARISLQNLSPGEFSAYYHGFGVTIAQGLIDIFADLTFKDDVFYCDISGAGRGLNVSKENFNIFLNSDLILRLQYNLKSKEFEFLGKASIADSKVSALEKNTFLVEGIRGDIEFNPRQLKWSDLNFKYLGTAYKTAGVLADFKTPTVRLGLSCKDLSLESVFKVDNKLLTFSKCEGYYRNCGFSILGEVDFVDLGDLEADMNGELNINLEDTKEALSKFKDQIDKLNPQGLVGVRFNLKGNIKDIKSCAIEVQAKQASSFISVYGLKAEEFLLSCQQRNGIVDIPLFHLSLYGGNIKARANMNLNSAALPFWIIAEARGIKIEELKVDTAAKEKDIGGKLQAEVKLSGLPNDLSRLKGSGSILINEGRLWQLNLFKGLGALLFTKDFTDIIFNEGSCEFGIQDKQIFTDNLVLKSNITNLSGSAKIGFGGSVDASLNVQILDEMVPLSGTFKDFTTAILGKVGRFGVIKISGTLNEPKFSFQNVIGDVIKGLKDIIFGK